MAIRLARATVAAVLVLLCAAAFPRQMVVAEGEVSAEHVVVWGDTLSGIAVRYGVTLTALQAANGLDAGGYIYIGQHLAIPEPGAEVPAVTGAPSAAPEPRPVAAGEPTVHLVRYGETLLSIALTYGVDAGALAAANDIANPRLIYAGQSLVIPAPGDVGEGVEAPDPAPAASDTVAPEAQPTAAPEAQPTAAPEAQPTAAPEAQPTGDGAATTYTVQKGDNLSSIAAQHGITLDELLAANDIANPSTIYPGTVLQIPAGAKYPVASASPPQPTVTNGKQVVAVLSTQRVYAFENGNLVNEFLVSTGLPNTPTIQGDFSIYLKIPAQRMTGEGYDLANVQWVSYFRGGYSFHGTWWHSNFGRPMSHGCVNMRTEDAQWLYEWAPLGTSVRVIE